MTTTTHYYVDEAGDSTLFDSKGKIIIGEDGNSKFFIMGLLSVGNPTSLYREMNELRIALLSDPYYKNVPSMQPEKNKTAIAFHAKDDLPEVRHEVYKLLKKRQDIRFFCGNQ